MAIAFVKKAIGHDDFSTSIPVTVPAAGFAAGNKLICAFFSGDASAFASGIVDTAGNPYTSRHQFSNAGRSMEIWEGDLTNALVSGNTITATNPGGGGILLVNEFSGLLVGNSLDKQANASSTNNTFSSGATAATTQADELIFGAVAATTSATCTFGADAPYSEADESAFAGIMVVQDQYQIVSATGAYTSTGTISTVETYIATVDTFKGAAAPPPAGDTTTRRYQIRRSRATSW